jgi:cytoplasmic iron level regulating protein YaaA (DUF328/UPF0246 family)
MFRDALKTARMMTTDDHIRILSAKHGLVRLDHVIEPYDLKMTDKDSVNAFRIVMQLVGLNFDGVIHALLPKPYFERIKNAAIAVDAEIINHYEGCTGIGFQKARLKALRDKAGK